LLKRLADSESNLQYPVLFLHPSPGELKENRKILRESMRRHKVVYVGMAHRHYDVLLNDGRTVCAATRSSVQIEEAGGQPSFSVANIDRGVISWKSRKPGESGPFVMITSPADRRMITDLQASNHVVRGQVSIRAKAFWSDSEVVSAVCKIDGKEWPMNRVSDSVSESPLIDSRELINGLHMVTISVKDTMGRAATDKIEMWVHQNGLYIPPTPVPGKGDLVYDVGPWPEKGISGPHPAKGYLGPNEHGGEYSSNLAVPQFVSNDPPAIHQIRRRGR
jgi:3',5'-cyclic-AMP phosphodiesterase